MPIVSEEDIGDFIRIVDPINQKASLSDQNEDNVRAQELAALGIDPKRYRGDMTWGKPSSVPQVEFKWTALYYFGKEGGNKIQFYQYFKDTYPMSDDDIARWIDDAKADGSEAEKNKGITDISWDKKPGEILFCVDVDDWEVLQENGNNRSLYFVEIEDSSSSGPNKFKANRNHSFFDAVNREISDSTGQRHILTSVKNYHLKAPDGMGSGAGKYKPRKNGEGEDLYKFDLYVRAKIKTLNNREKQSMIVILDPAGRNTGP